MEPFRYVPGTMPVVVSIPHAGTHVPPDILERFAPPAKRLPDTDWHVDRLYAFARDLGVHLLIATHSRYVIDVNRAPDDASLYPGRFTTGLCPVTLFDGAPLYRENMEPGADEIVARRAAVWQPYHDTLRGIIDGLSRNAPRVTVFDAHSIRSRVPLLFDGQLPDLNLGTAGGVSADPALADALLALGEQSAYSAVLNGRFKGGYITRHCGRPAKGVHAVQLELAQCTYMEEDYPYRYDEEKAAELQVVLRKMMERVVEWVRG